MMDIGAIQQRSDQIADELRQNNMKDTDLGKLAQNVSVGMKEVGQQNMPRAAADLSKAQQANPQNAKEAAASMSGANGQQDQAITTMEDLLKELAATGDFDTLRAMTLKLLDDQQKNNKGVTQLAPKVTGQSRNELSKPLQEQEDKLANEQRELSKRTADLLERLEKAAQANSSSDQASSQSMQAAANVGKQKHDTDAETTPLRNPEYYQYDIDLPDVAEVWRRGSVIASWLLDLTAGAFMHDPELAQFSGRVSDSGEGRWTLDAAIDEAVPAHVLATALFERFSSRGQADFQDRLLSAMRFGFGGHLEKKEPGK